jgi:enoyl-CoA hydratase/carnithine racemase
MTNEGSRLVLVEADGVAQLTFDHPASRNSLDLASMARFASLVAELQARTTQPDAGGLRAVLLTGAGEQAFCSGGDQRALGHLHSTEDGARLAAVMGDALAVLEALPVPVIAAVNGHALGGGAEIALACDLRVVDEDVRFGLVHARLALTPGWGAGQRLMRLVGYPRALQLLLEARPLDAATLDTLRLVAAVAPPGGALPAARALCARWTGTDPATVRDIKAILRAGLERPGPEAAAFERSRFPLRWASPAHLEAMRAFDSGRRAGRAP